MKVVFSDEIYNRAWIGIENRAVSTGGDALFLYSLSEIILY